MFFPPGTPKKVRDALAVLQTFNAEQSEKADAARAKADAESDAAARALRADLTITLKGDVAETVRRGIVKLAEKGLETNPDFLVSALVFAAKQMADATASPASDPCAVCAGAGCPFCKTA